MQKIRSPKNPRKQRKLLHNAPAHMRHKLMGANVSPELAASKGAKTIPLRKGDTVKIMRGDHKGFEGKVSRVDLKNYRVYIEGLTREKVDGTTIFLPIHPSKVQIRNLNLDDKWRKAILERKAEVTKEARKVAKPTPQKKAEKPTTEEMAKPKAAKPAPKEEKTKVKEKKPKIEEKAPALKEEKLPEEKPIEKEPIEAVAVPEIAPKAETKPKATSKPKAPRKAATVKKKEPKAAKEEKPAKKEAAPAKEAKPRAAAKKAPAAKKTTKASAAKAPTKRKTTPKTEGGK